MAPIETRPKREAHCYSHLFSFQSVTISLDQPPSVWISLDQSYRLSCGFFTMTSRRIREIGMHKQAGRSINFWERFTVLRGISSLMFSSVFGPNDALID
jgi:hypothetical protein